MRSHARFALGWLALMACLALAVLMSVGQAHAEGAGKTTGKIAASQPWTPYPAVEAPETWPAHSWYMGLVGGYAWTPSVSDNPACGSACDDVWHGGIVGGYLYRSGDFGLGVEADYVLRDLGDMAIDDGMASVRARAGVFVGASFLYGTVGIAQAVDGVPIIADNAKLDADDYSRGLVVGGGLEREIAKGLALRGEVLHYRHTDEYFAWGEEGSTAARVGLVMRLN